VPRSTPTRSGKSSSSGAVGGRTLGVRLIPYGFLAPAVLVIALVFLYPLVSVVVASFVSPGAPGLPGRVGIENFVSVLGDPLFRRALLNNLRRFTAVPVLTVASVLIAAVLYERIGGWRAYRAIVFLPYVIAVPVIGIVFSYILQKNGLLNQLLAGIGLPTHDWLGDSSTAIWSVWVVIVWQQLGFGTVLFLAALSSLDPALLEAGRIDWAGWWQRLWHIELPHLASTIEFFVTLSFINMLSWVFNYIYVMTGGGPVQSTYVLELVVYNNQFRDGLPNRAAAASVITLGVAAFILLLQALMRRQVERLQR
jgi:ABC-type sugar transport system permease subunit